jgi:beta-glucanase (GH16 family)
MTTGYHTYGAMWDAQHITFYFDGNETGQLATPPDMHTPMYLLADLAMQDLSGVTDDPKHLYIDYIRAYSNDPNATATSPTRSDGYREQVSRWKGSNPRSQQLPRRASNRD